jgi:hypothetical protein
MNERCGEPKEGDSEQSEGLHVGNELALMEASSRQEEMTTVVKELEGSLR